MLLRSHILITTTQWVENRPGFLEADTVAHCSRTTAGMFAYTIDWVDIATGWSEQRAVWGKGEARVLAQIHHIEQSLCRSPCSNSIPTTAQSSSTTTSSVMLPRHNSPHPVYQIEGIPQK
jgi:hypothetical protein